MASAQLGNGVKAISKVGAPTGQSVLLPIIDHAKGDQQSVLQLSIDSESWRGPSIIHIPKVISVADVSRRIHTNRDRIHNPLNGSPESYPKTTNPLDANGSIFHDARRPRWSSG
jgi:hypothetical protein